MLLKLGSEVTTAVYNFRPTIVGGTAKHCTDQYICFVSLLNSLRGNNAMQGGLYMLGFATDF